MRQWKKRSIFLFALLLCSLCGCGQRTQPSDKDEAVQYMLQQVPNENEKHILQEIDLSVGVPDDRTIECVTASGGYVYFEACKPEPGANDFQEMIRYQETTIYQFDMQKKTSSPVVTISDDGGLFLTNELVCVGDRLFWTYRDEASQRIDYYNMTTGEQGTLADYSVRTSDVVLTGDDRYLTWYAIHEDRIALLCFDTTENEVLTLTERAAADSPYTRAYVGNGMVAYLEEYEKERKLVLYDLNERKEAYTCSLDKNFLLTRLQTNGKHTICTEGYEFASPFYILNQEKGCFEEITFPNSEHNIFSCHLYDDYIIINSHLTDSVLILSLENKSYSVQPCSSPIVKTAVSPSGLFYGRDTAADTIFCFEI